MLINSQKELVSHRLANMFQLTNISVDKIWKAVKQIKMKAIVDNYNNYFCHDGGLYKLASEKLSKVKEVEALLEIESSEQRFENVTLVELKIAAEMFIFLNVCPKYAWNSWFKSWFKFYDGLFKSQTPDRILLTLNRMMKSKTSQNTDGKARAEKLFKRISNLLSLSFKQFQSILPGGSNNRSRNYVKEMNWRLDGLISISISIRTIN